jgi:SAM-dependent methyltransferase
MSRIGTEDGPSVAAVLEEYEAISQESGPEILNYPLPSVGEILGEVIEAYKNLSGSELADVLFQLDDSRDGRSGQDAATPRVMVEFLAAITPEPQSVVLDLACGQGRFLEYLAMKGIGNRHIGRDINGANVIHARQVALLRGLDISFEVADGLSPVTQGFASLVFVEPPLGLRMDANDYRDWSWPFGQPSKQDSATGFMQRAIEALEPGGTAFVITTAALLQRGGSVAEFRRELLMAGVVRGIVALPSKLRHDTSVPLALWILNSTRMGSEKIWMVDASLESPEGLAPDGLVAQAVLAEFAGDEVNRNKTYATSVPVTELLTKDVVLRPAAWVAKTRDRIEPEEQLAMAREELDALESLLGPLPVKSKQLQIGSVEPNLVSLDSLKQRGAIKIFGASMVRATEDGSGPPVLEARFLGENRSKESVKRLPDGTSSGLEIRPGDVVVGSTSGGVETRVWYEEGWVAGSSVQVIRVLSEELDPTFLASAIEHPRNIVHIDPGAFRVQANIRSFEIPEISLAQQKALAGLITYISDEEQDIRRRIEALINSKAKLLTAIASGVVAITSDSRAKRS